MEKHVNDEIKDLIEQTKHEDVTERRYAFEDLAEMNDPSLVDVFIEGLSDDSTAVKEVALDAIIDLKSPESISKLIELLRIENVPVRNASVEILNSIASVNSSPLIDILSDKDDDVVKFIADILICNVDKITFSEDDVEKIKDLLNHNNQNVAGACSELLAQARPKNIVTYLEEKEVINEGWIQYSVLHILKDCDNEAFEGALEIISTKYKTPESELIAKKNARS